MLSTLAERDERRDARFGSGPKRQARNHLINLPARLGHDEEAERNTAHHDTAPSDLLFGHQLFRSSDGRKNDVLDERAARLGSSRRCLFDVIKLDKE
jgi:hypothetical protein